MSDLSLFLPLWDQGCLPVNTIPRHLLFSSSAFVASPAPSPSLLFQIIRKVVRQIDSSGAGDTQEHEEVIVEGPPEDPRELEADIDYFMTHIKVLRWPPLLRPSLLRVAWRLYLLLTSAPAHSGFQSALC